MTAALTGAAALGAAGAFASSATWAFASVRYAEGARVVGGPRLNLFRTAVAAPIYLALLLIVHRSVFFSVGVRQYGWLIGSVLCSYAIADSLFFAAAKRLGASTALAIASTYPLWASLAGVVSGEESFGLARLGGCALCVGGVVTLVYLSGGARSVEPPREHVGVGVALALATSLLWGGNSLAVNRGSIGLDVWQVNLLRYGSALIILSGVAVVGAVRDRAARTPQPAGFWLGLLPATITDTIFGSVFFVYGLSHATLAVAATLSSLAPFLSVPFAIWRGQESWDGRRFLAIVGTVAGVVLLILWGPTR